MSPVEPRWPRLGLHVWIAWALVAAPLFDVLRRNPEYLVAHDIGPARLAILFGLSLALVPLPSVLLAAFAGRRAGWPPWLLLPPFLLLGWAAAISAGLGRAGLVAGAVFAGVALVAYRRAPGLRRYCTWLAPVALVAPALLVASGLNPRPPAPTPTVAAGGATLRGAPTVVLILDELPITTLLDDDGTLDGRRFPRFAALASQAHWFDNVLSVDSSTPKAVSALLSGAQLVKGQLPTARDLPETLFTLLAPTHRIVAFEPITRLCPPELNHLDRALHPGNEWLLDTLIVALHLTMPEPLAGRLPSIDAQWTGFGDPAIGNTDSTGRTRPSWRQLFDEARRATQRDRVAGFEAFLEAIDGRRRGALYVSHLLLPHRPWIYLPSGATYWHKRYREPPGFQDKAWPASVAYAEHAHQRHLLQAEYVDRLLGRLVERLREQGIYDDTLLAITADHGISFLPGEMKRGVTDANRLEVLQVPVLLKLPGQQQGVRHHEPRSTLDLLPTLLAALDVEVPATVEGRSLLTGAPAEAGRGDATTAPWRPALDRRAATFGSLDQPHAVYATGPARHWLGRPLAEIEIASDATLGVELLTPGFRFESPSGGRRLPAWVHGRLTGPLAARPLGVALALDGFIRATAGYEPAAEAGHFRALLPEDVLTAGSHQLAVVVIDPTTDRAVRSVAD